MKFLCALLFASLAGAGRGNAQDRPTVMRPVLAAAPAAALVPRDSVYVPILVYHGVFPHHPGQTVQQKEFDVPPEVFDAQMAFLRDSGYRVISFESVIDALEKGEKLPPRPVVITFDDGRENQYVHAFPILRKYGYTATFFVYPNPIVNNKPDFMTWSQLKELQSAGMTIGSHTYTHPKLTLTHDPKDLKREIVLSRTTLQKQLGAPVDFIAFPFGLRTAESDSLVKVAGYRAARGFLGGGWQSAGTIQAMRSFEITENMRAFRRSLLPTPPRAATKR